MINELDKPETTIRHKDIIQQKPFLYKVYTRWYAGFAEAAAALPEGRLLEIGSGGGFLKEVMPQVYTSDILPLPYCDGCFSAESIPFEDNSTAGIFMLNVFHHIPDPAAFLKEAERVLVPGGAIIMIEPAHTPFSSFIYKNFHHAPFDTKGDGFVKSGGPLSGSNQALPWIIFSRDRSLFEQRFPQLEVVSVKLHSPLRYIISGGLSKPALLPSFMYGAVTFSEKLMSPLNPLFALFQTIKIQKKEH